MDWNKLNPLQVFREGAFSLFSDGKISLKRVLAFIFSLAVIYMVKVLCTHEVPAQDQELFKHCFDSLLITICVLTGAATVKDIIALKAGKLPTDDTGTTDKPGV